MSEKKLKAGDRIYRQSYYSCCYFGEIDRVTNTQAFIADKKFRITPTESNRLTPIAGERYSIYSYYLETPKIKELADKNKANEDATSCLESLSILTRNNSLTPDQATEIIQLSEKIKKEHGL